MKTIYEIIAVAFMTVMSLASCEKNETPSDGNTASICSYIFDNKEYPVLSMAYSADESGIYVLISPLKKDAPKTTYAILGINADLEGTEIDIEKAWHNDDYFFIYEDPLRHYSYYRKLTSGSLMIKKNGEHFKISANLILPDGTGFQFEYNGKIASTTL